MTFGGSGVWPSRRVAKVAEDTFWCAAHVVHQTMVCRIAPKVDGMLTTVSGARTDVGRRRVLNEDSILDGPHMWAVADGMGGHAAGDVASRLVIESLRQLAGASHAIVRPSDIPDALNQANETILHHTRLNPTTAGMGSTVAGLAEVVVGGQPHWAVFNVGDSRVYRCFGGAMSRATTDHSEVEELLMAGRLTEDEARTYEARNVITRSIGTDPAPEVDLWVLPQSPGERFLVCSDGLTSELDDSQIAEVLLSVADPGEAADRLMASTLEAGARDNVSIIVVDVFGDGPEDLDEKTLPKIRVGEIRPEES